MKKLAADGSSPTPAVRVGKYALEFGSPEGTFALFESLPEETNARRLAQALGAAASERDAPAVGDALGKVVEDAVTVTERSERCVRLFNDIAGGKALDPKVVSAEIDALVDLLGRLDRTGRHQEALRLARDLSALLALLLRWLELVRSLRLAVRTARAIGDGQTEAWALHELGSLHLGAGDPIAASAHLSEALRIRDALGGHGRCASRHNLDAARRDLPGLDAAALLQRRRWFRLVSGGAALALLAGGGLAVGLAASHPRHTPPSTGALTAQKPPTRPPNSRPGATIGTGTTTVAGTLAAAEPSTHPGTSIGTGASTDTGTSSGTGTATAPDTTTSPPPPVFDESPPQLTLEAPTNGSFLSTTTPTFSGTAGLAAGDLATIVIRLFRASMPSGEPLEVLTADRDDGGGFSVAPTDALTEDVYTARAEQADRGGNVGHAAVTFRVDLTPPVLRFTRPKAGERTTETPTFSGAAGTLPGDLTTIILTVSKDDAPASSPPLETLTASRDDSGSWSVDSGPMATGEWYRAVARQADEAGHTGSAQVRFFVPSPPSNPE
jgi:hypothetical protein